MRLGRRGFSEVGGGGDGSCGIRRRWFGVIGRLAIMIFQRRIIVKTVIPVVGNIEV